MYEEVELNNAVFDLQDPQEASAAHAAMKQKICPYGWTWRAEVQENGDVVVRLTEYNRVRSGKDVAIVAHFSAEQIVEALQTKWNRPTFAHCTAEGKLARWVDDLRHRLERIYTEEYDGMLFGIHSGAITTNRVIDPPLGLLTTKVVKDKKKTTVMTFPTGEHHETVLQIAWGETLLACFKQSNQYDTPYGGRVFDIAEMLRRATRDI